MTPQPRPPLHLLLLKVPAVLSLALAFPACKPAAPTPAQGQPEPAVVAPSAEPPATQPTAETPPPAPAKPAAFDPSVLIPNPAQRQAAQLALLARMLEMRDPASQSATAADFLVAPASLTNALQALWWGTRGETALEMARLFRAEPGAAALPEAAAGTSATGALGGGVVSVMSSGMWLDERFAIRQEYTRLLRERGLGLVEKVNWSDLGAAQARVNDWARQATNGRVGQLLTEGSLRPPVAFLLASVAGFQGTWASPFDPAATQTQDFTLLDGSKRPAALMSTARQLRHTELSGLAAAVELPFSDGRHRLLVLLPAEPGAAALRKVEAALASELNGWLAKLAPKAVSLVLPRFNISGAADPRAALEAAGVRRVFSDKEADFSGASEVAGLKLDAIQHQARVQVDESGAEAVAATAASVSAKDFNPDAVTFRADRPFFFLLLGDGNEVLFAGRVTLPPAPVAAGASAPQDQPAIRTGVQIPAQ